MKPRLFVAIPIPKKIQTKINAVLLSQLVRHQKHIKIVPSQNLHVTLLFLGSVPKIQLSRLANKFEELSQHDAFTIELKNIGSFKQRVLWLGIQKGSVKIAKLARILASASNLPESVEPHVTLARNKKLSRADWTVLVSEFNKQPFCEPFEVNRIHLMQSITKPGGSQYEKMLEWKLRTANKKIDD